MRVAGMETGELALLARAGDVDAFTDLVRRYQAMAFGFALSRLGDRDQAEDAAQQAFITAYRSLDKLRQPERFGGWLRSIVYYECAHIHRARSTGDLPLSNAELLAGSGDPHTSIEHNEDFGRVFDAIRSLPSAEREATILFYLQGHSQREVASFLDVPVTTVNNRLRNARKRLRKDILDMANDAINDQRLPESFASRIGEIIRVEGPVIDARFTPDHRPQVLDAFTITGEDADTATTVQAIQFFDNDLVRCVRVMPDGARIDTGMRALDTGGPVRIPLQISAVEHVLSSIGGPAAAAEVLETGIKAIDLLTPLPCRGRIALVGDKGTGKMALVEELIHRLADTGSELTIFVFVQTPDEVTTINALEYRASSNVAAIYLPVADASPEALGDVLAPLDAVITFSSDLAGQGLFPAIDPTRSTSRLLDNGMAGATHRETASRLRKALATSSEEIQALRAFLTQPFFVAEPYTKIQGTSLPLEETIRKGQALLDE